MSICKGLLVGGMLVGLLSSAAHAAVISETNSTFGTFDLSSIDRSVNIAAGSGTVLNVTIEVDFAKCDDGVSPDPGGGCTDFGDSFAEELAIRLEAPDGTLVTLVDFGTYNNGGNSTTSARATVLFDDAASTTVGGNPITSGTFAPVGSLSDFDGLAAAGPWTLHLLDNLDGEPSGFFSFTLNVETQAVQAVPGPGSSVLIGLGALGLAWSRRRRRSRAGRESEAGVSAGRRRGRGQTRRGRGAAASPWSRAWACSPAGTGRAPHGPPPARGESP